MKISSEEKDRTRIKILNAAVDVITEKGFKSASMREISRHAQVGDATIYNYFSTKEKLLYGYCEYVQQQVLQQLKSIDDFHQYTLHEQLQQLVELELQTWLPAREFLQQVYSQTFAAPVAGFSHLSETRRLFCEMVTDMLASAIEVDEIPQQPYQELLPRLFWDYMSGILTYWLKDDSENFSNTTRVVDSSMEIVSSILYKGLVGKSLDLASLIFRTHVMPHMDKWKDLSNDQDVVAVKRRFMRKDDD